MSLAITSVVLCALAFAFSASASSYAENVNLFDSVNKSRQALGRIISDIRTADSVNADSPANECALITSAGNDITYQYDAVDGKVYVIDNSTANRYILCENVTSMSFEKYTVTRELITYVTSVQVSMQVESGGVEKKFSAAAAVRRNLE